MAFVRFHIFCVESLVSLVLLLLGFGRSKQCQTRAKNGKHMTIPMPAGFNRFLVVLHVFGIPVDAVGLGLDRQMFGQQVRCQMLVPLGVFFRAPGGETTWALPGLHGACLLHLNGGFSPLGLKGHLFSS